MSPEGDRVVVVTGSTRGIGYGLAEAFLERGQTVVVCGRTAASVDRAVAALSAGHPTGRLLGVPCRVTESADHEALWDAAKSAFGRVDIWINNAGIAHSNRVTWELDPQVIQEVIATNVTGALLGSRAAIRGMLAQGHGHLYNMEGLGSNGMMRAGSTVYGASKRALTYLTRSLELETRGTPVLVSTLSPGMVVTELLMRPAEEDPGQVARMRRVFNILADRVETVTPWLANAVLANRRRGARIDWLTPRKVFWRFATAGFRKRDLFTGGV